MQQHSLRMRRNLDGTVSLAGARFTPVGTTPSRTIVPPSPEAAMRVLPGVLRGEVLPPDTRGPLARGSG